MDEYVLPNFIALITWMVKYKYWTIPLLFYLFQLVLKLVILQKSDEFKNNVEKLGEELSFIGLSFAVLSMVTPYTYFQEKYAGSHTEAAIIILIIFIPGYAISIWLHKGVKERKNSKAKNVIKLSLSYLIGYTLLVISIRLLLEKAS